MATEAERKFLVKDDSWLSNIGSKKDIFQAYLSKEEGRTVRIRKAGDSAFLTIKGTAPEGSIGTPEFEYAIPAQDADDMLKLCLPGAIEKTRHYVEHDGKTWEVDIFHGDNEGLVMAEIELNYADEPFTKPAWAGEEVTFDPRFKNSSLASNPYKSWGKKTLSKDTPKP